MSFFEKYPLIEILENSNFNGLGWGVTSVLFYLSLYHFVLFIKSREKFYLFYSLYALINGINLIQRVKGVFVENIYTEFSDFFIHLNFPIQFASFLIFSFFLIEILNFRFTNWNRSVYWHIDLNLTSKILNLKCHFIISVISVSLWQILYKFFITRRFK